MSPISIIAAALVWLTLMATASHAQAQVLAENRQKIVVALPFSGAYGLLGEQLLVGLQSSPLADIATLDQIDTQCDAAGAEASLTMIDENVTTIIGFMCPDAFDVAVASQSMSGKRLIVPLLPALDFAPTVDSSSFPVRFHFAPAADEAARLLGTQIAERWAKASIALIDDGTLTGREFVDTVRAVLQDAGIEPVYVTNYRPQIDNQVALVRLIERAGATHVVIGGDRFDASRIADAMDVTGYRFSLAGGPALSNEGGNEPLPQGTLIARLPDFQGLPEAGGAVAAIAETGQRTDGLAVFGYALGQTAASILDNAETARVETAIGPVTIGAQRIEMPPLYRLHEVTTDKGEVVVAERDSDQ